MNKNVIKKLADDGFLTGFAIQDKSDEGGEAARELRAIRIHDLKMRWRIVRNSSYLKSWSLIYPEVQTVIDVVSDLIYLVEHPDDD